MKFKVGDDIMYEDVHYPNTCKLTLPYLGPYKILNQLFEVTFEKDRPNLHFKRASEIVHSSELKFYNHSQTFKLLHENVTMPTPSLIFLLVVCFFIFFLFQSLWIVLTNSEKTDFFFF